MSQDWETEKTIEPLMALRLIQEQFPKLNAKTIKLLGGWDNTSFVIDDEWIFRFPRRQVAVSLLQSEWCALPKLASRLPVPIPMEQWKGNPSPNFPWPFTGYRKISGFSACSSNLTDPQRVNLAIPLANFLKVLHSTPVDEFTQCHFSQDHKSRIDRDILPEKIRENLKSLSRLNLLKEDKKFEEFLGSLKKARSLIVTTLVHGDFYARHILLNDNYQLAGVIDWGDIHIGDPAIDLAIAHSFLPVSCHEVFRKTYGNISEDTWTLSKLRGLLSATLLVLFGHHINHANVIQEGLRSIQAMLDAESTVKS